MPCTQQLKPGTRLVREWRGRTCEVLVLDDGFSWRGSAITDFRASREQFLAPLMSRRDDSGL